MEEVGEGGIDGGGKGGRKGREIGGKEGDRCTYIGRLGEEGMEGDVSC